MKNRRDVHSPARTPRAGLWVVPQQRSRPSPRPPTGRICDDPSVRVHGIIYAWLCYEVDPRTGRLLPPDPVTGQRRTRLDYVGQTIRSLDVRAGEHLDDKSWADVAVSDLPIIVEQGMWTKAERDAKEIAAIHRLRPRYNYEHNLGNPERIEIWRQLEHRHFRDRAAGQPLWLPLEQRSLAAQLAAERAVIGAGLDGHEPRYPLTVAAAALVRFGGVLLRLPRRVRLAAMALAWWVGTAWSGNAWLISADWPPTAALVVSVMSCATLTVALLRAKPVRRWARRRRRR